MHRFGVAQHQLRPVAGGTWADGPAERLRHRLGARPAAGHRRRGARRPRSLAVLRPRSRSRHGGTHRSTEQHRPPGARWLSSQRGRGELCPGRHPARGRLRLDVQRRLRRHQPRLHVSRRHGLLGSSGQHSRAVDDDGYADGPDGRCRHEQRPVRPDLHEPARPGRCSRRPRHTGHTPHALDAGGTGRGAGPACVLGVHGSRHAGDDRGQLLQLGVDAAGVLRRRRRHQRPRELGR